MNISCLILFQQCLSKLKSVKVGQVFPVLVRHGNDIKIILVWWIPCPNTLRTYWWHQDHLLPVVIFRVHPPSFLSKTAFWRSRNIFTHIYNHHTQEPVETTLTSPSPKTEYVENNSGSSSPISILFDFLLQILKFKYWLFYQLSIIYIYIYMCFF